MCNGVPSLSFLCLSTQRGDGNVSGMNAYDALQYNAMVRYSEQVEDMRCTHIVPRVATSQGTSAKWIGMRCTHIVPRVATSQGTSAKWIGVRCAHAVPRVYYALQYNAMVRYNEQAEDVRCTHIVPRVAASQGTSAKWIGVRCAHAVPRVYYALRYNAMVRYNEQVGSV